MYIVITHTYLFIHTALLHVLLLRDYNYTSFSESIIYTCEIEEMCTQMMLFCHSLSLSLSLSLTSCVKICKLSVSNMSSTSSSVTFLPAAHIANRHERERERGRER